MSNATHASSTSIHPVQPKVTEARLENLLSACRRILGQLNKCGWLLSASIDSVPDKDDAGMMTNGLLELLMDVQNDAYSDLASEIKLAEGGAA